MLGAVFSKLCLPGQSLLLCWQNEGKALTERNNQLNIPGMKGTVFTWLVKKKLYGVKKYLFMATQPILFCTKVMQINSPREDRIPPVLSISTPCRWEEPACCACCLWHSNQVAAMSKVLKGPGEQAWSGFHESRGRLALWPISQGLVNTEFSKYL